MAVWAIADLHLSFARPERRERSPPHSRDHVAKIERESRHGSSSKMISCCYREISRWHATIATSNPT